MVHCLLASWALHGVVLAGEPTNGDPGRYDGYALIEVQVPDADSLAQLLAMGVDPWVESPRVGAVPVLVSPDRRAAIDATGWTVRVLLDDVQPEIERERERLSARTGVQHGGDPFADYVPLDDVNAMLDAWAAAAPELATVIDVGMSIEGRTIRGLRIGTGGGESPAMLVVGGQHAREWISVTTALWIAARFVEDAADPEIAALLAELDVVVVPVVNPDGYVWSWESQRLWRKNRRDGVGVDTNRNFGYGWGGEGAGFEPEAENYAGPEAFSEPESAAVRDWVLAHDELVAFVDLHSFGQLLLWPWGHIYEPTPDADALESMGGEMAEAMHDVHDTTYTAIQGVNLYPAAGNAIDWAYGDAALRAYTIELRPGPDVPEFEVGFILDPDQIVPVGEEAMEAILVLAQWSAMQGEGDTGSDTTTGSSADTSTTATTADTSDDGDGTSGSASATDATLDDAGPTTASASATNADDSGSSSGGTNEDDDASGCSCTSEPDANALGLAVLAIVGVLRRRRSASTAARHGSRRVGEQ
jgi:MYXO-CTERM domain-containing protein